MHVNTGSGEEKFWGQDLRMKMASPLLWRRMDLTDPLKSNRTSGLGNDMPFTSFPRTSHRNSNQNDNHTLNNVKTGCISNTA